MKTVQKNIESITTYFKRLFKINTSRHSSELILNPIYQNNDDRQLFI